jgi:hypothetical protein
MVLYADTVNFNTPDDEDTAGLVHQVKFVVDGKFIENAATVEHGKQVADPFSSADVSS